MMFAPIASLYPAQPSYHAAYQNEWNREINRTTATWAYVVTGEFPYAQWMSWNIYDGTTAVPTFTFSRTAIRPDPGASTHSYKGCACWRRCARIICT